MAEWRWVMVSIACGVASAVLLFWLTYPLLRPAPRQAVWHQPTRTTTKT